MFGLYALSKFKLSKKYFEKLFEEFIYIEGSWWVHDDFWIIDFSVTSLYFVFHMLTKGVAACW